MQILHPPPLLSEKEDLTKDLRRQHEERRSERIVNLGDHVRCPQCYRTGRVVWVSEDGRLAGIQCPGRHSQMSRGESRFGSAARPQTKLEKNMVFLLEAKVLTAIASVRR